ncbi:MAG: hypothetical protein JSU88_12670 [Nitrospinaceae bacterium]|nr:MAG: hypothetical protein JSU88_12670 [Nitrospinaceae bacterium]
MDGDFSPAPINEPFLGLVSSHLVVPELSRFNFEINSTPHPVAGALFRNMGKELAGVWENCGQAAAQLGARVLAIGSLPTLCDEMLNLDNISAMNRYHALNREVLRLRENRPLELNIEGRETLYAQHHDVMLEAATTSLQIHLQVNAGEAARHYNLSQVLSAPMVAVAANSPYLFTRDLWEETRIPVFEQAVRVASFRGPEGGTVGRVTFGTGYCRDSIFEVFLENLDGFPVLLPLVFEKDICWLSHLRLHNGTIWRWNRPLIGLNDRGRPHIRIEHRVPAAGPSLPDVIGNIAFYIGLVHFYLRREPALDALIPFDDARRNFYRAARLGMEATVRWSRGREGPLRDLMIKELLPAARKGLVQLGIASADIAYYLDEVIGRRVESGRTGARWQRDFIARHGPDFKALTRAYFENQARNMPVYGWEVA